MEINSYLSLPTVAVPNLATGGSIPLALTDIGGPASVRIDQTTPGQTITIPAPIPIGDGRALAIYNGGTAAFTMYGTTIPPQAQTMFIFQALQWRILDLPTAPAAPPADFWRSGAGATTLPDGANDLTEPVRRNGAVGINVDPRSTLDIAGSFGSNPLIITAPGVTNLDASTHFAEVTATAATHQINLPAPNAAVGREYTIHLAASNTTSIVTVVATTPGTIELLNGGVGSSVIMSHPLLRSVTWKSDGSNWQLINAVRQNDTFSVVASPLASGSIVLNDPGTTGAKVINPGSVNTASATGLDNNTTQSRLSIVFSTPLANANYVVSAEIVSRVAAGWATNSDVLCSVVSKSTTGFVVAVRETAAFAQNINLDFVVTAMQGSATPPPAVSTKYVGSSVGLVASMVLGNFAVRYNAANQNLEIATVAGTETITAFCETQFGSALVNVNSANLVVTTAFQAFGDPGIIAGQERRSYRFGPVAVGDVRQYDLEFQSISATKVAMKMEQW